MSGQRNRVRAEAVPSAPRRWPLVGHLPFLIFSILRARGNFAEAVRRMLRDFKRKTLQLKVGRKTVVISVDPAFARRVLVDRASDFPKAQWEKRVLKPVMNGGLIVLEGNDWKEHRAAVAPCFSGSLIDELGAIVVDATRDRLCGWQRRIHVGAEMRAITSDVLSRFFLHDHRLSDGHHGSLDRYARTYAHLEEGLEDRVLDPTRLVGGLKAGLRRQQSFSVALDLVNRTITEQVSRAAAQPSPRKTALEIMLGQLTQQAVCQEITTLTAAGATTVHLLTWACQLLGTHPKIQRRLRCELPSPSEDGKWLSTLERCSYLAAVIHEALRLYPPAPYLLRQASPTFDESSPDLPPPSSLVLISLWGMHGDPDFFPSPEEFIPERWLGTSGRGIEPNQAFLPFGMGPRICIGRRFATIETMVILSEIVRNFEILPVRRRPVAPKLTILTRPKKDVVMSVEPLPSA
jgi:cytochrome P450